MALVKCPECGKMVSDMTDKCTDCGYPIYLRKKGRKRICPFCDSINYGDDSSCKNCGGQLGEEETETGTTTETIKNNEIQNVKNYENIENKHKKRVDKNISLLLCIFFGYFGLHKFYEGNIKMGITYLLTMGLFGFGWIIDIIVIAAKKNPYYV